MDIFKDATVLYSLTRKFFYAVASPISTTKDDFIYFHSTRLIYMTFFHKDLRRLLNLAGG
ncbi:hypothetical protein ACTXT7_016464, partial [Hymenolepis weldensis]